MARMADESQSDKVDKRSVITQGPIGWYQDYKEGKLGGHTPLIRVDDVEKVDDVIEKAMKLPYVTGVSVWFGKSGGCCLKVHRNRRTTLDFMTDELETALKRITEMIENGK